MAERTVEHWKDVSSKDEESHIKKHWTNKHSDEKGPPRFRFEVIKYCRSALERQIGEATRIALRKNCLNSKAGYNRSGVTRLTLKPEEIPATVRVTRREDWRRQAEKDKSKKRGPGAEEENDKNTNKRARKKEEKKQES